MSVLKKVSLIVILTFLYLGSSYASADSGWLVGVWKLVDDSKEEFLEFTADNTCKLVSGKGRQVPGKFKITEDQIKVVYNFKGKKIPIKLDFPASKDKLIGKLSNTGNSVEYLKQ